MQKSEYSNYWQSLWLQFKRHRLGMFALYVVGLFCLVGIYAPFLASSKPFFVYYDGGWYFPLFRYLFYRGFYTKRLDIFFNILIFIFPIGLLFFYSLKGRLRIICFVILGFMQMLGFAYFSLAIPKDPAADPVLTHKRIMEKEKYPSWQFDLNYMSPYAKLNLLLHYQQTRAQDQRLQSYKAVYEKAQGRPMPTVFETARLNEEREKSNLQETLKQNSKDNYIQTEFKYLEDRDLWYKENSSKLKFEVMPLIRDFHWEEDAGGEQSMNQYIPWWELTRINRKDLVAALIFGVRVSLVVGLLSVGLALLIGIPIGAFAGYYGGTTDIIVSRLLEIWESMPTFFMLLLVVAITQSKSIFIVIVVIGIFGWTSFSRYIRGEFFKQRNLSYVEASRSLGFQDTYIIFSQILPNAIPPLLTLLPFAIMGAITSEAGLSFLGLGEEGSSSWGVLMDEGRTAFPGESYLLWPPAILLTGLLIAIALVGDSLRDALDPKMHK